MMISAPLIFVMSLLLRRARRCGPSSSLCVWITVPVRVPAVGGCRGDGYRARPSRTSGRSPLATGRRGRTTSRSRRLPSGGRRDRCDLQGEAIEVRHRSPVSVLPRRPPFRRSA